MSEFKVIHANIYDPTHSVFKTSKNDKAQCQTVECSNTSCPLLAKGQCYARGVFTPRCPYGRASVEYGPTRRSSKFYKWVSDKREKHKGVPYLNMPEDKIAFIGEYVLLPYSHMDMNKAVPFLRHSNVFVPGYPFVSIQHWNLQTVLAIIDFKPQAMMGGEITTYQKDVVPKFLLHLRESDSEMWSQLVKIRPQYDVVPNHVGRKAILQTLNYPITWSTKHDKYPVTLTWDGKFVTTTSQIAFSSTWCDMKAESVNITIVPKVRTEVVVQSNDWVNSNTEFTT